MSAGLSANPTVVLTDYSLPDGKWTGVLHQIRAYAPAAEVVVSLHLADEQMWSEVLLGGGYDVIPEPFEEAEVLRVADSAWRETLYWTEAMPCPVVQQQPSGL